MFNHGHFAAQGRRVLADSRELVPTNTATLTSVFVVKVYVKVTPARTPPL